MALNPLWYFYKSYKNKIDERTNNEVQENPNQDESNTGVLWTICQMDFEEDQIVVDLDWGKIHIFHGDCLKEWFKVKMTCPTCRMDLNQLYSKSKIQIYLYFQFKCLKRILTLTNLGNSVKRLNQNMALDHGNVRELYAEDIK